ncbi:MAG: Planctomycete cytochrome [Verrucomicrobiaceae bacterium]|nr:Planctomycete cytochrome [Verrucomicrobiaceae bacterium]
MLSGIVPFFHMICSASSRIAVLAMAFLGIAQAFSARAAAKLTFNKDIRPLLSDKCFFCHGPDPKKREAKLRLDERESAISHEAILPGKPEASEMIKRILATDDDHMPPAKSKLSDFTPAEVAILKQWIAEGAEYEAHWAFIPLKDEGGMSQKQSIDTLVESGLKERGLKLQPEADATTLIRRVSFDLTGLPPTPAEVNAFVAASKTEDLKTQDTRLEGTTSAYAKLVDRLLASEHYGERMAVDWLDLSRYADSYGFQVDREREVWPWRDWVVKAFNSNLPYNDFITWQIAGDLLPHATDDQILATAFNRLHQQESEGGSVEEEYRVEYVCDRVQTFSTAFLGLTFECSRCHDHKFDPITQKDYYGLFALFQNIDEAGLYSYFTQSPPTPTLALMDQGTKGQMAALTTEVHKLEKQAQARHKQPLTPAADAPFTIPGEMARYSFDALDKNKLANSVKADQPATLKGENKLVPGHEGNAVQFTGDDALDLPVGNFHRHDPFSVSLWLKTPDEKARAVLLHRSQARTDAGSRGYELLIEEGRLKWSLIHFWPGNAISIRAKEKLALNEWTQVVVTNDGSSRAAGLHLFVNGKPVAVDIIKDNLSKDITGGGHDNISLGERMRDRGFKGGAVDDFRVFDRELTALEAVATYDEAAGKALLTKSKPADPMVRDYLHATTDSVFQAQLTALHQARAKVTTLADGVKEMMVMRELPKPQNAHILFRGQYDQRKEEVEPHVPVTFAPSLAQAPKTRLGLAQWLTNPQHPLTARVTVNRYWQSLFGRGLVKTAEDFGSQGARPLYPEVLDWLAIRYIHNGWDTKALIKTLVMSRTYRQRSIADARTMTDDPDNEWLARGPRFRLGAEMIRDNALAASSLLNLQVGGPPVNAYEMMEAFKPATPSGGDGVYRRSLYSSWRRTSPPPAMIAFDAPRRAVCTAKRDRTDSPLQSFILLNGTQYVEAARVLGQKLYQDAKGDVPQMINAGFLRCLSRLPDAREMEIMTRLYREQSEYFRLNPTESNQIIRTGNAKQDPTIPSPEAAAATILAQALLNHDACVVKR